MDLTESLTQQRLIESVRTIAERAGEAIMAVYETPFDVDHKADNSPLTAADRAAHEIIRDDLAELSPYLPLLSEESAPREISERRQWQSYWLVDPLDGTREFVKRNDEFTVNIALVVGGRAVLGVVRAPAIGLEYFAATAIGAWRQRAGEPAQPIRTAIDRAGPTRVLRSRSHASPALTAYLERIGPHETISMGSSLKICLVADGQADIYPRLGPTSEWDTAAAQAILETAGGNMIDLRGRVLRYNSKDSLLNPHFLAVGDIGRDWLSAVSTET